MWPNPQFSVDLVTFTEEILKGRLYFLCSAWLCLCSKMLIALFFSFFLFVLKKFLRNLFFRLPDFRFCGIDKTKKFSYYENSRRKSCKLCAGILTQCIVTYIVSWSFQTKWCFWFISPSFQQCFQITWVDNVWRSGSRTAATSKVELFVIIVNGFPRSASVWCYQSTPSVPKMVKHALNTLSYYFVYHNFEASRSFRIKETLLSYKFMLSIFTFVVWLYSPILLRPIHAICTSAARKVHPDAVNCDA